MSTVEAIKNFFLQTGAAWVLWLLFGLSFISIAIVFERIFVFRTKGTDLKALADKLDRHLGAGDLDKAHEALRSDSSLCARVAEAGLRLAGRGPATADKGMQSAMAVERSQLEARLAYLGTLGNNAPFIGLFGTVIGIILAFNELGQAQTGNGGQMASQAVMGSISEALVATAVGIAVALPAVAAYNYFQRWMSTLMADAEALSNLVLAYLCSDTQRTSGVPSVSPSKSKERKNGHAHESSVMHEGHVAREAM